MKRKSGILPKNPGRHSRKNHTVIGLMAVCCVLIPSVFFGQGVSIGSGAFLTASNSAIITISNSDFNNNGTYTMGTETLIMSGSTAGSLTGNNTTVNSLTISNTGGITTQMSLLTVTSTLTVNSGAKLTVASDKSLTSSGSTILNGSESLVIATEGSFIDNGITYNSGSAKVEHYLSGSRWWYIGSPMTAATAASFGTLSGTPNSGTRLFYWNEPTGNYINITDGGTTLVPLKGYSYKKNDGNLTAAFTGSLNTGTIGSDNNLTRNPSLGSDGFNLVCNPYPSAINWGSPGVPASEGLIRTGIETTIWYRTNSTYSTYNYISGTGAGDPVGQQYIPAMQSFWIHVPDAYEQGTLKVDNTTRVHNSQPFYKSSPGNNIFRIRITRDEYRDDAVVGFYGSAKSIYEDYDSEKFFLDDYNYPQIYTLTTDNAITVINGLPEMKESDLVIVPMGLITYISGKFTLESFNLDEFDPDISVYLEDVSKEITLDLRRINTYTFTSNIVNNADRFRLWFKKNAVITPTFPDERQVSAYSKGCDLFIDIPVASGGTFEVFTLLGERILRQHADQGLSRYTLSVASGIYLVRVQTIGQITIKKVFIGK